MALFNKEPDKNAKPQEPLRPPTPPVLAAAPVAPQTIEPPAPRPTPPASNPLPSDGRAYLDRGSKISGKLFFEGPVRIDGQVDGEISANDQVTVGEGAILTAQLKAAAVVIAGKISGDIIASKRIEIRPTAKVFGNLTTPTLVVHEGAQFEGHCTMRSEPARDERKVTPIAKEERLAQAGGGKPA